MKLVFESGTNLTRLPLSTQSCQWIFSKAGVQRQGLAVFVLLLAQRRFNPELGLSSINDGDSITLRSKSVSAN